MDVFTAIISGIGSAIGRQFFVVSFIPSLYLTGITFALIESGAWSGNGGLNWARAGDAFTNLGSLALLTLISLVIGLATHPIQFALVQFFEGYWGTGWLAQRARTVRILHYLEKYKSLQFGHVLEAHEALLKSDMGLPPEVRVSHRSIEDESMRLAGDYPDANIVGSRLEYDDIMPTRLGNVLRRHERRAGSQYGLDAVSVIQHISLVAPPERLAYLADQRQLLDVSVRMSATSIVATLIAISALWRHGAWLLFALVPYGIAYLSYRGAIVGAHGYGTAITAMIDLDRFALYDALRLRRAKNTAAERRRNAKLTALLYGDQEVVLRYKYPDPPGGQSTGT